MPSSRSLKVYFSLAVLLGNLAMGGTAEAQNGLPACPANIAPWHNCWGAYTYPDGAKYEGAFKDDKREGQGIHTYSDGAKYEGVFKGGKYHGQGTFTWPDGRTYVGAWKGDKREGQGALTFPDGAKYEGAFKDGKYHGQGTYTWPDGRTYVGAWKDDKRGGQGTLTFSDGAKYEGAWKDGKFEGRGTYSFSDGRKYEGAWKDGKYDGQGILTLPNGATYVGAWKDGKREGQGTITWLGAEYVGTWREDKLEGYGTFTIPNVGKYVGAFKGNKQEGQGTQTFPDGTKYEGAWKNGEYNGQGTYTYADGAKYEGAWEDGKREGQGTYTYPDGWTYVGTWKDDKREGQGTLALPSGSKFAGIWADDKYIRPAPVPIPEADVPILQQPNSRGGLVSPPLSTQLAMPAITQPIAPRRQRIDEYIWSAPVPIPEADVPTLQQPNSPRDLGSPPLSAQFAKPAISPPIVPGRQRAAMLVQQSVNDKQNITTYVGTTLWHLVPSQRSGTQGQSAIRADVNLPEIRMRLTLTIEKNTDPTLRASHTMTIRLIPGPDAKFPAMEELGAPQMRNASAPAVQPLAGVQAKINDNIFIIALTDEPASAARNIETLKTRGWFDFPMRIADGRIAKITMEKGADGDKLIKEALDAWHGRASNTFLPEPRRVRALPVLPNGTIIKEPVRAVLMSPSLWSDLDSFLQSEYKRCWTFKPASGLTTRYVPQLEVHYLVSGGLAREPKLRNPPSDPALLPIAESAMRAVKNCNPLNVPQQFQPFYTEWKSRILRFDPVEMRR